MGRREVVLRPATPAQIVYRYDCDGCGAGTIDPCSRIQFGTVRQSGPDYRRYLCGECTKHLRKFLRHRAEMG